MAEVLTPEEREYLIDAAHQVAALEHSAPNLPRHTRSAFEACRRLCEMLAGGKGGPERTDFLSDGTGELSPSEVGAIQELVIALRLVVNGCIGCRVTFREAVVSTLSLAETWVDAERTDAPRHLEAVTV